MKLLAIIQISCQILYQDFIMEDTFSEVFAFGLF